jgi:hypothetical protein
LTRTALLPAAALVLTLATRPPAFAEFTIVGARIAEGDLWVIGQVDEPNTPVTLDGSYTETSDRGGRFQFRIAYHPATCTVIVKTERQSRAVVVANCGQRGPQGEPGPRGPPGSSVPIRQPDQPRPERAQGSDLACDKAALYEADKGLKLWVMRSGTIERDTALNPLSGQGPDVVLQVNVGGSVATAYGPDFANLLRGGPPEWLEAGRGRRIAWSTKLDHLSDALQIVSEDGSGTLARFRFKQCGTVPERTRETSRPVKAKPRQAAPSPEATAQEPAGSLPNPRGAIQ